VDKFIQLHQPSITGVLRGFDRVMFRGTPRLIANVGGMRAWLNHMGVFLKDFGDFALNVTEQLKRAAQAVAEQAERPVRYLPRGSMNKEEIAREIARRDGITEGLVCVLTSLEVGMGFDLHKNREAKRLELVCRPRRCLHIYQYLIHPVLGWMNARLQTWFPLTFKVCINGRRWLARQMDAEGIQYAQRENTFVAVSDLVRAQGLLDDQLKTNWPGVLDAIAMGLSPGHREVFATFPLNYYWSADETEWATDVMFRSQQNLARLYPGLIRHAMGSMGSVDVMRFLADRTITHVNGNFKGQVVTDLKERPEGIRVKHRVGANTVKMYDKQGSVLRIETTINHARGIKVYRRAEGQPDAPMRWQRLRKGVSDLHRRAQVSDRANARYLDALAAADTDKPIGELAAPGLPPGLGEGQAGAGAQPAGGGDARLLVAVARGEFTLNGFRNRDLRSLLFDRPAKDQTEEKRRSSTVSRKIRMLRAHG